MYAQLWSKPPLSQSGMNQPIISDTDFIFTNSEFDFDIQGYLEHKPGILSGYIIQHQSETMPFSEFLRFVSHSSSINPKILLTILEIQTRLVDNRKPDEQDVSQAMGVISKQPSSIDEQLLLAANQLATAYYDFKYGDPTFYATGTVTRTLRDSSPNAATYSLLLFFSQTGVTEQGISDARSKAQMFIQIYEQEFGIRFKTIDVQNVAECNSPPDFQLPFPGGESWQLSHGRLSVAHGDLIGYPSSGINKSILAAIDFVPPGSMPCRPTPPYNCSERNNGLVADAWVAAPFDTGTVVFARNSFVVVTKTNSLWAATFYHIHETEMITEGTKLEKGNLRIGHPSNSLKWGGNSPWSHVHFAMQCNGEYKPAVGLTFSGWHIVNWPCQDCAYPVALTKDNQHYQRAGDWVRSNNFDFYGCQSDDNTPPGGYWESPNSGDAFGWYGIPIQLNVSDTGGCNIAVVQITASYKEWWEGKQLNTWPNETIPPSRKRPSPDWYWHILKQYRASSGNIVSGKLDFIWPAYGLESQDSIDLSFDIFDQAGNKVFAPHGIRTVQLRKNGPEPPRDNASTVRDSGGAGTLTVVPNQQVSVNLRLLNSGTIPWGSGYQLVFLRGDQMGTPNAIDVPATAPGVEVDLSLNLTAPNNSGNASGYWQLRNPQGTYFGPEIWVSVNVVTPDPGGGKITSFDVSPSSPSAATSVYVVARATYFPEFRSMRFVLGGQVQEMTNFRHIGDQVEISADWDTSTLPRGDYTLIVEVARNDDLNWGNPERQVKTYTLTGTPAPLNRAPNRPDPLSPYDWYVYYSGNTAQLCVQNNGDPDGDAITGYYFDIYNSAQLWNSGWTSSNCVTTGTLGPYGYQWRAKVRDNQGAESGWSDTRHFTLVNSNLSITELYFEPQDANSEQVKIRACTAGQGGVGITMRVSVNDASDGSGNGEWHILKELGVPCFNTTDAPIWNTLDYGDGPHRVRVEARGTDPSWNGAAVREEIYTLPSRRPSGPRLIAPATPDNNGTWWNNPAIAFRWQASLRADSYQLRVSANADIWNDPAPVLDQTLGAGTTAYTHTFGQDYNQLYWGLRAGNSAGSSDSGGGVWFGLDRIKPSCIISDSAAIEYESVFQVNWSGSDNASGIRTYDIQYRDSERGTWNDWLTGVPEAKTFEVFNGQPGHTYAFRCRATDSANNTGEYPAQANTTVTVDPTSRPQTHWWNPAYSGKRNLVIQNNTPGVTLPVGYPVHLQFDGASVPTAAELYAASQAGVKCDDLRVVYDNMTELDRVVQTCNSSAIDIWFRSQIDIAGGAADSAAHQLYYGNASPDPPKADPNQVWYPYAEADTAYLYFFQEGSGSTAYDSSGNNHHCSIDPSVTWADGKFSRGLRFNHANFGDSRSLNCGAVTPLPSFSIDFWYKPDADDGGRIAGALAGGGNGGGGNNWLLQYTGGHIRFDVWDGAGGVQSNFDLRNAPYADHWNHIAVTYNGGTEVKFYINGNPDSTKTMAASGINLHTPPLEIGSSEGIGQIKANLGGFRISNGVKTSFPYGAFAAITTEPTANYGDALTPPVGGAPDLAVVGLDTFPNPDGGILVQAVIENRGSLNTQNGFYTDLYLDHLPTGTGVYTGSVKFWVNDPIAAGAGITLTTLITDLTRLGRIPLRVSNSISEITGTLYAQTDSTGVISETNNSDNIFDTGVEICLATNDMYEPDDLAGEATNLPLNTIQTHNINTLADEDWFQIQASGGVGYVIQTANLSPGADTYLYLYDTNGTTLLAANDDYGGTLASRIEWTPAATGTYYVAVKHWNPNVTGCGTSYDLSFTKKVETFQPANIFISGPTTGVIRTGYSFTATVGPITTTVPITYYWQTAGQSPVTHTGGLSDTVAFTWNAAGVQVITVTATNPLGVITGTHAITIYDPVSADFTASPRTGPAPLAVAFSNLSNGDFDTVQWNFGDGSSSAVQNPAHQYTQVGKYTVRLTVSGLGGTAAITRTNYITVKYYVYLPIILR